MRRFIFIILIIFTGVLFLLKFNQNRQGVISRSKSIENTSSSNSISSTGIAIGVYTPAQDTTGRAIDRYTDEVGKKPAFAWMPTTWKNFDGKYNLFDEKILEMFRTRGIMPGVTWNPTKGSTERYTDRKQAVNQVEFSWKMIATGAHDEYISKIARDVADYKHPFLLRFLHEMDGTWYPWGYNVNSNTETADYINAWKHIVEIFRKEKATNAQFVWCPSVLSADLIKKYGNILRDLYPGDDYVDWIALDGYSNKQNGWRSLGEEFQPSYDFLTSFSNRPLILWEVGAMENPDNPMFKANWITEGFMTTIPTKMPQVKVVVWFNSIDGSDRDYRLQTSKNAMNAWRKVIADPLYQGNL